MPDPQTTEWPTETARNLAVDLERRGSMEGHYVWPEMIQRAFDLQWADGYQAGRKDFHKGCSHD